VIVELLVSLPVTIVRLSGEQLRGFEESRKQNPAIDKLYELEVAEVTARGGLALEIWRLHMGQLFGEPVMMTSDQVANKLDMPEEEVQTIVADVMNVVLPRWHQTPEYRGSEFPDVHRRIREGKPPWQHD
jgi:hypothetical protein